MRTRRKPEKKKQREKNEKQRRKKKDKKPIKTATKPKQEPVSTMYKISRRRTYLRRRNYSAEELNKR